MFLISRMVSVDIRTVLATMGPLISSLGIERHLSEGLRLGYPPVAIMRLESIVGPTCGVYLEKHSLQLGSLAMQVARFSVRHSPVPYC